MENREPAPRERVRRALVLLEGSPHSEREEWSPEEHRLIKTAIVIIPGGCYWARATHHSGEYRGCSYCNFEPVIDQVTENTRFRVEDHLEMVRQGLAEVAEGAEKVCIFTGGSFAPRDIPEDGLLGMVGLVGAHPTVRHLMFESRPELLTREFLTACVERLGGKRLEVAIGFETQDDAIRNGKPGHGLNKGMPRALFEKGVRLIKEVGAVSSAYVMLKPFEGLSEREGIRECLATLDYVFAAGVDKVLLQATFPQESAKELAAAWQRGEWQPPLLSSIRHVLEAGAPLGPIMLGRFADIPPPLELPRGCDICTEPLMALFEEYRRSLDVSVFNRTPICGCGAKEIAEASRHKPSGTTLKAAPATEKTGTEK